MIDGRILNSNMKQKKVVFLPRGLIQEIKKTAAEENVSFSKVLRRRLGILK